MDFSIFLGWHIAEWFLKCSLTLVGNYSCSLCICFSFVSLTQHSLLFNSGIKSQKVTKLFESFEEN